MVHHLSRNYCGIHGKTYPCPEVDATVFQMVDEPRDALWHQNKFFLNEDVCLYVPSFTTSFRPMCLGHDCTISKVYSDFLKAIPDRTAAGPAFLNFMKAQTEAYTEPRNVAKSYPWMEAGMTLASFAAAAVGYPSDHFRLDIDRNTPVNFANNKWGLKTPLYSDDKAFIRTLQKAPGKDSVEELETDLNFQEEADAKVEDQISSDTKFLFRRRRSSPPPPPVIPKPVIIHTNTFKMHFMAKDVKPIRVQPGAWFDRNLIKKYAGQVNGFFGAGGKLSLIPTTFYVAIKPRVEITVSESQFGALKNDLDNRNVLYFLVGGTHFKNYQAHLQSDDPLEEADEIYYEEVDADGNPINATVAAQVAAPSAILSHNHEETTQESDEKIEKYAENSDWFWRRRRRPPPPPPRPPPPPPRVERNYRVVFQSNSNTPQIVAVISDQLP